MQHPSDNQDGEQDAEEEQRHIETGHLRQEGDQEDAHEAVEAGGPGVLEPREEGVGEEGPQGQTQVDHWEEQVLEVVVVREQVGLGEVNCLA